MNTSAIQQALTPLVGLSLRSIGRAAGMLWLQFGNMREVPTRHGGTKTVGDWAIHVQCSWRLCRRGRIVVARRDYFYSPEGDTLDDWDIPGKSRFDQLAKSLSVEFESASPFVLAINIDDVGGFALVLSHDYRLDVFPDDSGHGEYDEHWRLLKPQIDGEHFVVP